MIKVSVVKPSPTLISRIKLPPGHSKTLIYSIVSLIAALIGVDQFSAKPVRQQLSALVSTNDDAAIPQIKAKYEQNDAQLRSEFRILNTKYQELNQKLLRINPTHNSMAEVSTYAVPHAQMPMMPQVPGLPNLFLPPNPGTASIPPQPVYSVTCPYCQTFLPRQQPTSSGGGDRAVPGGNIEEYGGSMTCPHCQGVFGFKSEKFVPVVVAISVK